jgi:HEAT repeat protein
MLRTTLVSIFTFALLTGMPVGCAPKVKVKPDFDSPVPQDRLAAVAKARRTSDENAVEPLIRMLASDDPLMRLVASDTLVQITGEDFGYDPAGSDPERRQASERWANWFASKKDTPSGRVDP